MYLKSHAVLIRYRRFSLKIFEIPPTKKTSKVLKVLQTVVRNLILPNENIENRPWVMPVQESQFKYGRAIGLSTEYIHQCTRIALCMQLTH